MLPLFKRPQMLRPRSNRPLIAHQSAVARRRRASRADGAPPSHTHDTFSIGNQVRMCAPSLRAPDTSRLTYAYAFLVRTVIPRSSGAPRRWCAATPRKLLLLLPRPGGSTLGAPERAPTARRPPRHGHVAVRLFYFLPTLLRASCAASRSTHVHSLGSLRCPCLFCRLFCRPR